jgi:hypothetical protein
MYIYIVCVAVRCSVLQLQHTATHCNTLQHTAVYYNMKIPALRAVPVESTHVSGPHTIRTFTCVKAIERTAIGLSA